MVSKTPRKIQKYYINNKNNKTKTWCLYPACACSVPWPLWLTSLAVITLLMTVWRKSLSPATLGEKREMFSCLWRMASSNASLQYVHNGQNTTEKKRWRKEEDTREGRGCEKRGGMRERDRGRGRHRSVTRIPWQTQGRLLAVNSGAGGVMTGTNREIIV